MRKVTQNWVGYLDRSAEQIYRAILNKLTSYNPELTDHSKSNPLIILIDAFSGIAEILHLYIDSMAEEAFIGTARKFSSVLKLAELLDYRVKTNVSSSVDLKFTLSNNAGEPTAYNSGTVYINKGTIVNSLSGVPYVVERSGSIAPGLTSVLLPAKQYELVNSYNFGISDGSALQAFALPEDYAHKSLILDINGEEWTEYDSFGLMDKNTKGFIVTVFEDTNAYLVFGDGVHGAIPTNSYTIMGSYHKCQGALGNTAPGSINEIESTIFLPTDYTMVCTNPDWASGGSDLEDIAAIRMNGPIHLATRQTAVTYKDYHDLAILTPGVGQAKVYYPCADDIRLYIAPTSRGIASSGLLLDVLTNFNDKKIVGRKVTPIAAGLTRIYLGLDIVGRPGYTELQIREEAIEALEDNFGYGKYAINDTIKPSDIIGVLESEDIKSVDSVTITKLYLEPYARPIEHTTPLSVSWGQVNCLATVDYSLTYQSGNNPYFLLYRNGLFWANIYMGVPYSDNNIMSLTLFNNGLYTHNQQWKFRVFPSYPEVGPVYTVSPNDYSVPMIDVDNTQLDSLGAPTIFSTLNVTISTGTNNLCK